MKKSTSFIIYFIIIFFSCKKDTGPILPIDPPPPTPDTTMHIIEFGKVIVLRDSMIWAPSCIGTLSKTTPCYFTISTVIKYSNGIEESFYVGDIPCKKGKYQVERGGNSTWGNGIAQANMGWVLDGDQVLGGLKPDTLKTSNFVEIVRYDSLTQIAEGKFQIFMKNILNTTNGSIYPLPDSLSLTEGKFHLKLTQ